MEVEVQRVTQISLVALPPGGYVLGAAEPELQKAEGFLKVERADKVIWLFIHCRMLRD
jgi:hypothetical protein